MKLIFKSISKPFRIDVIRFFFVLFSFANRSWRLFVRLLFCHFHKDESHLPHFQRLHERKPKASLHFAKVPIGNLLWWEKDWTIRLTFFNVWFSFLFGGFVENVIVAVLATISPDFSFMSLLMKEKLSVRLLLDLN